MAEIITVAASTNDGRVRLWEVHPAHPSGEAFVSGDGKPTRVALTARVKRLLAGGSIVHIGAKESTDDAGADDSANDDQADNAFVVGAGEMVGSIPAADYDRFTAADIVAMMETMSDDQREAVKAYEAAHKKRKTILEA